MKRIILVITVIALLPLCACKQGTPEVVPPTPSIGIEDLSTPVATLPEDITPDPNMPGEEDGEDDDALTEVDQNTQDLEDLLEQAPAFDITYDKNLKSSFIFIAVKNKTKSTLRGGLVFHVYDDGKLVDTVPVVIDEEDNEDNTIRSGASVTLAGEVEGRDCTYLDIDIASDPANPFRPVS